MEKRAELSPRLQGVAEMIPEGARLADVGTDHAYLPAWLLQNGRIPSAIASDVREGPLSRARATARACGCFERMSFRCATASLGSLRRRWTLWSSPGWVGRLSLISWKRRHG